LTTVAHKSQHIGADKRRTSLLPGGTIEYDDSVTKVFKCGAIEWGQAGLVGLTELLGLHLQGFNIADDIRTFYQYCCMNTIDKHQIIGQVLVYSSGKRFILQTNAELIECGNAIESADISIPFFSIGSGSEFAFPILMAGGGITDAIKEAMKHDNGTGGGIDMAHEQHDKNNAVTPPTSAKDFLHQDGFVDEDGNFTKKSLVYTPTQSLNFEELAKIGLVNNITKI